MYYTIQMASKISGLTVHTLRAWENRHDAVKPERDEIGRRMYRREHVERLIMLNQLVQLGHTISRLANKSTQELNDMLDELGVERKFSFLDPGPSADEIQSSRDALLLALRFDKLDIIAHEFDKLVSSFNSRDIVFNIMRPLMKEAWDMVQRGELTLSKKHSLATLIKYYLRHRVYRDRRESEHESTVIVAPDGDRFELQLLQAALLFDEYGKKVIYLGPGIPVCTAVQALEATGSQNLLVWASRSLDEDKNYDLNRYVFELQEKVPVGKHIYLGNDSKTELWGVIDSSKTIAVRDLEHLDDMLASLGQQGLSANF